MHYSSTTSGVRLFCLVSVLLPVWATMFEGRGAAETAQAEHARQSDAARAALHENALFRYVAAADDNYGWTKRREGTIGRGRYVELTLTSQVWRDITWKHQLFIVNPSTTKEGTRHALLMIEGGNWREGLDEPADDEQLPREAPLFAELAEHLQTPLAVLLQVPHQPILGGKIEDQIIAYTFEQFLRSGESDWPLLLPMTKSAVRALDAVSEFAAEEWSLELETFTVAGASKRGWTAWLTGAVDPRVTALAPMVIDMLNMQPQMLHQKETWGDYSREIGDYTERGLQEQIATQAGRLLREIVDPWSFRAALRQPKLMILGTNDPYWPLDALNLYWNDLEGDKYVLYVPNNRHGLYVYPRVFGSVVALHRHARLGNPLPKLDWSFEQEGGTLRLRMAGDQPASRVRVWMAASATRDFRRSRWLPADLPPVEEGADREYTLRLPPTGYVALFGEWQYESDTIPYFLSTNVRIASRDAAREEPR